VIISCDGERDVANLDEVAVLGREKHQQTGGAWEKVTAACLKFFERYNKD
jgi:hypothetical protein